MRTLLLIGAVGLAALAGCGEAVEEYAPVPASEYDGYLGEPMGVVAGGDLRFDALLADTAGERLNYAQAAAPPPPGRGAPKQNLDADALAQAGTLLAYSYGASLVLPARNVRTVMSAHEDACRDAGMAVCQILAANVNESGPDYVYASLTLRAAPDWLTGLRGRLESDARDAEGRVAGTTVTAEDLTRAIVDTEARLRAQRTLAERLEGLLASETDDVGDLLSVERELARVLGEIDSAAAQLEVMRRRVEMSVLDLSYASAPVPLSGNAFAPLGRAFNQFFMVFAGAAGMIVSLTAFALPWVIVAVPLIWALRRWWRARRARRAAAAAASG